MIGWKRLRCMRRQGRRFLGAHRQGSDHRRTPEARSALEEQFDQLRVSLNRPDLDKWKIRVMLMAEKLRAVPTKRGRRSESWIEIPEHTMGEPKKGIRYLTDRSDYGLARMAIIHFARQPACDRLAPVVARAADLDAQQRWARLARLQPLSAGTHPAAARHLPRLLQLRCHGEGQEDARHAPRPGEGPHPHRGHLVFRPQSVTLRPGRSLCDTGERFKLGRRGESIDFSPISFWNACVSPYTCGGVGGA